MPAVAPQTRHAYASGTVPSHASSVELRTLEKRKERKRVTDREAQREHRKRKRQHVEELESKIDFLKRNHASSQVAVLMKENEELRKEVESLRSFFKDVSDLVINTKLASSLNERISSKSVEPDITSETGLTTDNISQLFVPPASHTGSPVTEVDLRSLGLDPQVDIQAFANSNNVDVNAAIPTAWEEMTLHDAMSLDPPFNAVSTSDSAESRNDAFNGVAIMPFSAHGLGHPNEGSMGWLSQSAEVPRVAADDTTATLPPDTSHDMLGLERASHFADAIFLDHTTSTPRRPWLETWPPFYAAESFRHETDRFLFHFPNGFSAEAMQTFNPTLTENAMAVEAGASWTTSLEQYPPDALGRPRRQQKTLPAKPAWLCFPVLLSPPMSSDSRLQDFIGKFHEAGSTESLKKLPKPTILDFLINSESNLALPRSVKQYLAPIRASMQLSELLASYWIISLLVRWHINRDEESFNDLPVWLRPTLFQTRIAHPLTVCFMPWPLLRDELILLAFTDPAATTEIMAGLGTHLQVDLCSGPRSHKAGNDTFGHNTSSLDGPSFGAQLDMTWESLADLRNWTLHDQFFVRFPQFRDPYQQSRQMLVGLLQGPDDNNHSR